MPARIKDTVWPLGAVALILLAWHFAILWFKVPAYLLPGPISVVKALWSGLADGTLWPHIGTTMVEIVVGYAFGCGAALTGAVLISEFAPLERAVYPLIVGFQSIPKVALAPLLIVWFGFEMESKIILVGLICFFPAFVNTYTGLKACDVNLINLYRAFGAGRWKIVFSVKLPAAAGAIFAGLEISIVLALTAAIVAELISSRRGLGYVIASSGATFDVSLMFACVVILAVIGIMLTQVIKLVRRRLAFWDRGTKSVATDLN